VKHFDAFSGYGGFTLACRQFGIETVGFMEVDKYANAVLASRFPEVKNYGDINSCTISELPDFDILSGGFPCQDLSVAGERKGLSGSRSGLFFSWAKILKEKAPSYFILENVMGLFSSQGGWDFALLQAEVASAGYHVEWGVVNAKWFTPQNRERVFIIGYPRGEPRREVFPIEGNEREVRKVGRDISFCLDSNYFKGPSPMGHQSRRRQLIQVGNVDTKGHNSLWGRVYDPEGLGVTLKAEGGGTGAKTGLYKVALTERRTAESRAVRRKIMKEEGRDWSPRRGKELVPRTNGLGNCVTAGQTHEHLILEKETRIRKLTPLECERLMGLPDEWTRYGIMDDKQVEISNTQRYKLCGNGIVVPVVYEILNRMVT
jgi:DNA (cytosine-5)-methyltransferase 1